MNYLKKTFTSFTSSSHHHKADHPHGADFEAKRVRFFEIESLLHKLNKDLKLYHKLWGELLAVKTQIFGYILLFYQSHVEKHNIIDELFQFHQKPFELLVRTLSDQYEHRVIAELEEIQKMFPTTDAHLRQLKALKIECISKQRMLDELKRTTKRYPNYTQLSMLDETCRKLRQEYIQRKKLLNRELDQRIANRSSMLDRCVIQMLSSDYNMYIGLSNTADVLKTQAMAFYQYRQYPEGLPGEYHDPPPTESGSLTSDSELAADESMTIPDKIREKDKDIVQSATSPATTSSVYNNELNDNFDLEPDEISNILNSAEDIDEKTTISDDIQDELLKSRTLTTLSEDSNDPFKSRTLPTLAEDSSNPQKDEPVQPSSNSVEPIEIADPPPLPPSAMDVREELGSTRNVLLNPVASLPPAPKRPEVFKRKFDVTDSDNINGSYVKEWWEVKRKKKNEDDPLDVYFYCKNYHPLGISGKQLNSFRYLHRLFDPRNTYHYSDKQPSEIVSPICPNAIPTHILSRKAVNLQNLEGS